MSGLFGICSLFDVNQQILCTNYFSINNIIYSRQ